MQEELSSLRAEMENMRSMIMLNGDQAALSTMMNVCFCAGGSHLKIKVAGPLGPGPDHCMNYHFGW